MVNKIAIDSTEKLDRLNLNDQKSTNYLHQKLAGQEIAMGSTEKLDRPFRRARDLMEQFIFPNSEYVHVNPARPLTPVDRRF
jgi:hypothetical protein